jgi:hypothetical protein
MGEHVRVGPLTYYVIESRTASQLGDLLKVRPAQDRFLLISLSITNGSGKDVSVPVLEVENPNGQLFKESENGEGVSNWMGVLRTLSPNQTLQGQILFDVPLSSYRLRLPDGGEPGTEKYAWVQIPLRVDTDSTVQAPVPGKQ